jgi:hypothetical protein
VHIYLNMDCWEQCFMDCSIEFLTISLQCLHGEKCMFLRGHTCQLGLVGNLNGTSTLPAMSIKSLACITPSSARHNRLAR